MPHKMTVMPKARQDTIVIGIGSPLRQDDRAGIEVVERLLSLFGPSLNGMVVYEPDICLSETLAGFDRVVIVDAIDSDSTKPFHEMELRPGDSFMPGIGMISHGFDWRAVLAMARDLHGHAPEASVIGITAREFGISDRMSAACEANAKAALEYLVGFLSK